MLGVVLTELGRLKEANEAYNRALSLTPDFLAARKNRSVNAFSLGDYKFAKSEFEDLVKLTPKDFVPHLFLGLLDMEQSQWSSALPHLLEAKRLSRDSARGSLALTRVHFAMGRRSTALESVREMRTRSRSTAAERFELGVLLAQYESNAEAAEVFQELWLEEPRSYKCWLQSSAGLLSRGATGCGASDCERVGIARNAKCRAIQPSRMDLQQDEPPGPGPGLA